jgi:hypothetical protein
LRAWGFKKYFKAEQWKIIARRIDERKAQQLRTSVEIHGELLSDAKVSKAVARYGYQTAVERFTSGMAFN